MSEVVSEVPTPARTAGGLLSEARQAQGMHIAALAASIKVSQRKLESLEADRFDELPDATFTRALAQAVCRSLKMDPAPVLALLPAPVSHRLEHVSQGINQPFRERAARGESGEGVSRVPPGTWAALALIVLALGAIAAKPFIIMKVISPAEVAGTLAALTLWLAYLGRAASRTKS